MHRIFIVSVMVPFNTLGKLVVIFCVAHLSRCRNELNVTRCPDPDVNTVEWKQYDKACQDKNPTYKFHCQQDNTGSVTTFHSYCAVPEQCLAGYYPFINGDTAECQRCSKGTYQTSGKISYKYKHPSCDENWSKPNPGEIECRSGSATENRRFKCNWMDGYIPDSNSTVCLCFSHDDVCSCYKIPCEDGKERNGNYTCVPSTNTSTSTSMKPPMNTSLKPPTTSNKTPDWAVIVIVIVIVIVVLIAIVIAVIFKGRIYRMIRKKRKKREPPNEPKDGTNVSLMPDKQEEIDNKENNKNVINNTYNITTTINNETHNSNVEVKGDAGNVAPGNNNRHDQRATMKADRRTTEIIADAVGNVATGDNHSGNQTATMSPVT